MTPAESLDQLVADGIIDAVVQRVKTGKEAEVFVVRKGEEYLAAKVYKERTQRNFKNNVGYMEGRSVRNTRDMRAMSKGTTYGRKLAENEWMHTEHDALSAVLHAGVRVPKPELFYECVLLMELVLDAHGQPAPRLIDVPMTPEEALAHHRDVVAMIVKMLMCDLIHGDLSPFNILMAWNGPTIIDLPQAVKAAHNTQAEQFLARDVRNVTEHFAKYAPQLQSRIHDGYAIWRKYQKRELTPDYFPEEGEGKAPVREFVPAAGRPERGPRPQGDRGPRPQGATREFVPGAPRSAPPGDRAPRPPRPQGERPFNDRPRTERPQSERPQGERQLDRPRTERPQGERPPRPQGDRPFTDRPQGERPPRPQGERPPRPQGERPFADRPQGERPPRPPGNRPPPGPRPRPPEHRVSDQRPLTTPHEPRHHATRSAPHSTSAGHVARAPQQQGQGGGQSQGQQGQGGGGRFSHHHKRRS